MSQAIYLSAISTGEIDMRDEAFIRDYNGLVQIFRELPSKPDILLVLVPVLTTPMHDAGHEVLLSVMDEAARQNDIPLLDLYPAMCGRNEYFQGDTIHMTVDGYAEFAREIHDHIRDLQENGVLK
jgi:lysophospholipase L1-like esterase